MNHTHSSVAAVGYRGQARKAAQDSFFDYKDLTLGGGTGVRYTKGNTYAAPNGDADDYKKNTSALTTLQRHVAFFDADLDGVVFPWDTFLGFYALGFGFLLSLIAVNIIHPPFFYQTQPGWIPDPRMPLYIANMHRDKHGSDSETYDRRGHFQKQRFDAVFEDWSSAPQKDALNLSDVLAMCWGRRNIFDFFGIFAFFFEWGSSYMLLWPQDGYVTKEDMHGIIDGSIFPVIAARRKKLGALRKKGPILRSEQ
ncbi:unnamed protein product [Tilletia controversa]|uniref:Uncharacterized protein n=3 Tax=Tilletia TaxID=13289 RepID=A0A8X7MQX2_9BASI|nr:hypothetical protein CF336_g4929 [Tilletia laevis]KAE8194710.1 hypothetical protein CF328_g4659 [Tilletia controversa]KAE8259140.1 hypothetical protein A4X03_0g4184 [Tilletia caries]KAE8245769.1 hypothetical protein A4X06_0g5432 [Tilletia controversa]CAD6890500.1 unnamed protein product [Tilletia caries]